MKFHRVVAGTLALLVTAVAGFAAGTVTSQEGGTATQLGKEHQWLAGLSGEYTATMRGVLGESKATSRIELAHRGLWSIRHFESVVMDQPYSGVEVFGFDPIAGKFVSVWADSMTPIMVRIVRIAGRFLVHAALDDIRRPRRRRVRAADADRRARSSRRFPRLVLCGT